MFYRDLIKKILFKYINEHWNIAIADMGDDLMPINICWLKHYYNDRWFADPFFIDVTDEAYIILVEEYLRDRGLGRLARLTVNKNDCRLIKNETVLELPTHLSFPIPMRHEDSLFIYPENGSAGETKFYYYGDELSYAGILSPLPLADPVIVKIDKWYYLLVTLQERCNGNILNVYRSSNPFSGYEFLQEISFTDNIARRAGKVFSWNNKLISPAQVCNLHYGEGISFQELQVKDGLISLREIKRVYPQWEKYNHSFHTYNVLGNKVVIDGNLVRCPHVSKLYRKIRHIQ